MTTTIEYSQMLDEIAKSANWHESLDSVSISRINQASQRLRELQAQVDTCEALALSVMSDIGYTDSAVKEAS